MRYSIFVAAMYMHCILCSAYNHAYYACIHGYACNNNTKYHWLTGRRYMLECLVFSKVFITSSEIPERWNRQLIISKRLEAGNTGSLREWKFIRKFDFGCNSLIRKNHGSNCVFRGRRHHLMKPAFSQSTFNAVC